MQRKGAWLSLLGLLILLLSGCISNLWTGAHLVYDRHDVYKKLSDYQLSIETNNVLYSDNLFKCPQCALDVAIFNGDILISGHLPSQGLLTQAGRRLYLVRGYKHLFFKLAINHVGSNSLVDGWITTKIRSQIFADSSIAPDAFKIVTTDNIVYLMGDVKKDQANKVIEIARTTGGVYKVVKLMKYFTYEPK